MGVEEVIIRLVLSEIVLASKRQRMSHSTMVNMFGDRKNKTCVKLRRSVVFSKHEVIGGHSNAVSGYGLWLCYYTQKAHRYYVIFSFQC